MVKLQQVEDSTASHWSGVFNLLTFDHITKKGRKTASNY